MKRIVYLLTMISAVVLLAVSCQHKDLYFGDHQQLVDINIHWEDEVVCPAKGMRVEFYAQNESSPEIGTEDFTSAYGGKLYMHPSTKYHAVCYDYLGSEINKIRYNQDYDQIQVYTNGYSRASYSNEFPDEDLATQPDLFYMNIVNNYVVTEPWQLDFYAKNIVETYTFEIRKVKGARYITSLAGACSGLSASYFLCQEKIVGDGCTIVFGADKDNDNDKIVGSFRTFGHCPTATGPALNSFTMEMRYPSGDPDNGYKINTWDVTDQMHNGTNHIILDWDITVIPTGETGSGFEVDVEPWDEVWIPLNL